jgi:accessory colonization factor AcfC
MFSRNTIIQLGLRNKKKVVGKEVDKKTVRIFSARACAAPLEKAAKLFQEQTGISVEISVCSRHCAQPIAEEATGQVGGDDFLLEIAEAGIHDLAIAGAEYLLDEGEVRGIIQKRQRRTIACRCSAIIVPAANPLDIRCMEDMAKPGVRVGVSVIDCLKGLWEDVSARSGLLEAIRNNICYYANGCVAIVEAVATNQVDAAFGWSSFRHMESQRISIIEMPRQQQVFRGTCVGLLSFAKEPAIATQFMDFLATPASRAIYKEFGWIIGSDQVV